MNERIEFNKKGEEILDFSDAYGVLRYEYLERFFPGSKKIASYLIKNRRLYKSADGYYIGTTPDLRPDKCMASALGVLADIFEKVQSHARAEAPAQISFMTRSGDYCEIVYVGYGLEAMVSAASQLAVKRTSKDCADITKRIIIVENKDQMTRLQIPGITRIALVQPDGSLSYYKGS